MSSGRILLISEAAGSCEVPPFMVNSNVGWCVTCDDVAGEGNDVAVKCGPVGVREREFLDALEDSDVAR